MKRLFLLPFLCLALPLLAMNGFQQIGYGTKARGMGGSSVGLPQDVFAIANNPAGLVHLGCRIDGGVHWLHQQGKFGINAPPPMPRSHSSHRNLIWPELGGNLRYSPCGALGLAIYCYGGFDTLYKPNITLYGGSYPGMEYKQAIIAPAWSVKIGYRMSLGIAVNAVFAWSQVRDIRRYIGLMPGQSPVSEAPLYATQKGSDHEEGISLRVGWLWKPVECFSLGATYQTPTWINRFKLYRGFFANRGNLGPPSQMGLGFAWHPHHKWTLAADVLYLFWTDTAQLRNQHDRTTDFGAPSGPGFHWHDRTVVRLGFSTRISPCLTLRGGYNYSPCPFDRQAVELNMLNAALVEHHLTTGLTYSFRCYELSIAAVYGFKNAIFPPPEEGRPTQLSGRQYGVGIGLARRF